MAKTPTSHSTKCTLNLNLDAKGFRKYDISKLERKLGAGDPGEG